jgi:hypothetical protein
VNISEESVTIFTSILQMVVLQSRGGIAPDVPSTATISDLLCVHVRVIIIPDSSTRELSGNNQQTSSSEAGETWTEVTVNFAYEYLFS